MKFITFVLQQWVYPPFGKFKPATTAKNRGKSFGCSCGCGDWTILLNLEALLLLLNYVKASSLRSLSLSLSLSLFNTLQQHVMEYYYGPQFLKQNSSRIRLEISEILLIS
jgi:glycerol-3-phosphate acyltransferase PlsY